MLAVIKTGGKQYLVSPEKRLKVEKLGETSGKDISFGEVLLVGEEDGTGVTLGKPYLPSARVTGEIIKQGRAKKISMLKYKPKKRYRLRKGHRQAYTEVAVKAIQG
jgi:large subunit ribosomal protein L21